MSFNTEHNRRNAGLPPTSPGEMLLKYAFWFLVGGGLLYFFDFNIFQYLKF